MKYKVGDKVDFKYEDRIISGEIHDVKGFLFKKYIISYNIGYGFRLTVPIPSRDIKYKNIKKELTFFELNKKYIFDINVALEDKILKENYENENAKYWVDFCNGKEVIIKDRLIGRIVSPTIYCEIVPWWCKEIKQ